VNKKAWLIVAAAFVVIAALAVGGMYLQASKKVTPTTKPAATTSQPKKTSNSINGSLLDLLSGGKTLSCKVTYPDNKGTGTIVVADKKFAGDFAVKDSTGKETVAHMISDGTNVYIWSQGLQMGVKMNLNAAKSATSNAQVKQTVDINQNVDMQCGTWVVDNSKFVVPTTVTFTDVSKYFNQNQTTTVTPQSGAGAINTSLCDQITNASAKAACIQALQKQGQ